MANYTFEIFSPTSRGNGPKEGRQKKRRCVFMEVLPEPVREKKK